MSVLYSGCAVSVTCTHRATLSEVIGQRLQRSVEDFLIGFHGSLALGHGVFALCSSVSKIGLLLCFADSCATHLGSGILAGYHATELSR